MTSSITGCWTGHYVQYGRNHAIVADLVQTGHQISGSMRDGHPECEYTLFEIAAELGLSSEDKEQIETSFRDLVPHATAQSIHYFTRLPVQSLIDGHIDGQVISFVKTYAGEWFGGYKAGGEIIGTPMANHTVFYEGKLTHDNLRMEGRWRVEANSEFGTKPTEGPFLLRRSDQELAFAQVNDKPVRQKGRMWWKPW